MEILLDILGQLGAPFGKMVDRPDFLARVVWQGLVNGSLYSLIALGFVLIFKSSGIFNFAQGIMVVFSAFALISLQKFLISIGVSNAMLAAYMALVLTMCVMFVLAVGVERYVLRPLVNQPDIIMFMVTIGLTFFLVGLGELIFGGEPKQMIASDLGIPSGRTKFTKRLLIQHRDVVAIVMSVVLVAGLLLFLNKSRMGRALRAVADDHQASLSVGISLQSIWVLVWFISGVVALFTGIMWGARGSVDFSLQIIALKALPVLMLGGLTSIPGAIIGGLIIGVSEQMVEVYWGRIVGGGTDAWFAYVLALVVLLFRPQGLFGEKIIERV